MGSSIESSAQDFLGSSAPLLIFTLVDLDAPVTMSMSTFRVQEASLTCSRPGEYHEQASEYNEQTSVPPGR